jgi:hypothetical protein
MWARENFARWLGLAEPVDYAGVQRSVTGWRPYAGLVYFHFLLDCLGGAQRPRIGLCFLRYEGAAEIQPAVPRLGFEQGLVLLPLAGPEEMHDLLPAGMQKLCDQTPVATPPKGLRAHEAGSGLRQRRGERRLPPLSAHTGGIAAEGGDAKTAEPILARLTGEAAAKLDRVPINDPALLEHRSERRLVELGVMTRARKASHIDEGADAGLAYHRHELFRRPSPMPDRPDDHRAMVPGWIRSVRDGNLSRR